MEDSNINELEFKKGLLYTSIELKYQEKSITIKDVIVDTGSYNTIIVTGFIEEMGIRTNLISFCFCG